MPIIAKDEKTFETPKPGLHQAVCSIVEDVGYQEREFNGHVDYARQVIMLWELKSESTRGSRFQVSRFYTLSLNEKANLRKDLEAWLGRSLTSDEIDKGFDVAGLRGKNCMLNIKVEEKNGKLRAGIAGISPLMDGMAEIKSLIEFTPEWIEKIKARGLDKKPEAAPQSKHEAGEDGLPF
ncbi:MAG: hypothetical protein KKD77_22390 [Gammaproteobacteria bacterium]|nr:hypothetical protein [Gammaproteobacteria bacterium]